MTKRRADRVREPVQIYLDRPDQELLRDLAEETGLPKAEVLRRGLRSLAQQGLGRAVAPGAAYTQLVGLLSGDVPTDLAARHDEYLYDADRRRTR